MLDVTAQSGPGNLLGNLLCSVSCWTVHRWPRGLLNIRQQALNIPGLSP